MLTYRRSDHLKVIGYSDSYFAECVDTRKSTLGFEFFLAGGAISWKSAKQSVVAAVGSSGLEIIKKRGLN